MMSRIALSLTLAITASPTTFASKEYGIVGGSLTVGESVFSTKGSAQVGVTPNLFYSGPIGFVDGSLANWQVLPYVGLSGQWRFAEVSDTFTDLPNGIEDRDGSGELGLTLGTVGARVTFLHDVTSEHKGYEIQLHLGRTLDTWDSAFTLTPYFEVDYRDEKLSNHLYGISAAESITSGLNTFNASGTFVYEAGLIGLYEFSPHWIGISKAEFIHHDTDSPLVQRDIGWSLEVGLTYRFAGL